VNGEPPVGSCRFLRLHHERARHVLYAYANEDYTDAPSPEKHRAILANHQAHEATGRGARATPRLSVHLNLNELYLRHQRRHRGVKARGRAFPVGGNGEGRHYIATAHDRGLPQAGRAGAFSHTRGLDRWPDAATRESWPSLRRNSIAISTMWWRQAWRYSLIIFVLDGWKTRKSRARVLRHGRTPPGPMAWVIPDAAHGRHRHRHQSFSRGQRSTCRLAGENIAANVEELKERISGPSVSRARPTDLRRPRLTHGCALVLGADGKGLARSGQEKCDVLVSDSDAGQSFPSLKRIVAGAVGDV